MKIRYSPWGLSYSILRALISLSLLLTLLANTPMELFKPTGYYTYETGTIENPLHSINLFFIFDDLEISILIAKLVLVAVVIGIFPAITGILHWWVAFSFSQACFLPDGGDQIASVLTFLLLPMTLLDSRKNHWFATGNFMASSLKYFTGNVFSWVIRLQIAIIYFHAGAAKINVEEWANGTAMYYWMNSPVFGSPHWLSWFYDGIFESAYLLSLLTWSVIVFELSLASAIFLTNKKARKYLFCAAIFFSYTNHAATWSPKFLFCDVRLCDVLSFR